MAGSLKQGVSSMNPWALHLQKLGLELKCPLCLEFLKRPFLLPCDHIFCNSCLPKTAEFGPECPLCKAQYGDSDLRCLPMIENMVTIYRSLDSAFSASILQSHSETGRVLKQCPASKSSGSKDKKLLESHWGNHYSCGQSKLMNNDLACAPSNCSAGNGIRKNVGNCNVPMHVKDKEHEVIGSAGGASNDKHNVNSLPAGSQVRARGLHGPKAFQMDLNQADQLSPRSPPSFGDNKDSENDSNDQGSDDSPQNYKAENLLQLNSDNKRRQESHITSASETEEGHLRDLKRHKKLNYSPSDLCANNIVHIKPNAPPTENLMTSSQLEIPAKSNNSFNACGFCQSSRITEYTGPMLHLVNGKPVEGIEATLSSTIHVHAVCIEWAPQVYYAGETLKNLKAELARGAKLKCSKCGLKGAALGCYLKSCKRSYHAPCAMEISKCRWDYENFLVLCPGHSSVKFPSEKSKAEKHKQKISSAPTSVASQQPNFWVGSCNGAKKWVFCGSALSSEEKCLLVKFGSMIATDSDGACTRTLKYLMAILNGKWVLSIDWIKACMESMHPVDEENYEIILDSHGSRDGPKNGRLGALNNAPKLFSGLSFYFVGDFVAGYKEGLQSLVIAAGGTLLESEEELVEQRHDQASPPGTLIVYNLDPPQGCKLGEEVSIIWQRTNEAQDLAAKVGSQVIGHTWLLESISSYKLQPSVN
ncbi:hypothetical protein OIU84_011924 [Salix udensis]|uniref:RING-type E3 ubiquitin transferase BRCA1 n=1 Tax=Salix udensis TaxID=889485 RepID=A0AAD6JF73_9ROSI|nr:hypothetical protein OIU84_011924 [Salix udensis]